MLSRFVSRAASLSSWVVCMSAYLLGHLQVFQARSSSTSFSSLWVGKVCCLSMKPPGTVYGTATHVSCHEANKSFMDDNGMSPTILRAVNDADLSVWGCLLSWVSSLVCALSARALTPETLFLSMISLTSRRGVGLCSHTRDTGQIPGEQYQSSGHVWTCCRTGYRPGSFLPPPKDGHPCSWLAQWSVYSDGTKLGRSIRIRDP